MSIEREIRFTLYGRDFEHITLKQILAVQRTEGDFWAHAETGPESDNCYCEVALWSHARSRYEKFAFTVFFGGEHPDIPAATGERTAKFVAQVINQAGYMGEMSPIVSRMPTFEGDQPREKRKRRSAWTVIRKARAGRFIR